MADEASKATPKKALANPIRRPGGPREALDGAEKLQKQPQKGLKRPQNDMKKGPRNESEKHQNRGLKKVPKMACDSLRKSAGPEPGLESVRAQSLCKYAMK